MFYVKQLIKCKVKWYNMEMNEKENERTRKIKKIKKKSQMLLHSFTLTKLICKTVCFIYLFA